MKAGWGRREIGDLCEVIAGQSPEGQFYNDAGRGMPFYQGKKDFGEKFIEEPTTWTTQITKVAAEGDVLMSVRAPVGPINFATGDVCIGRGLSAIRSGPELNREFLFYQLLALQPKISGNAGAVFASINKSDIERIKLAVPSLPEQKRIVGVLNEAFDGIATAKANAEKNLQNARALYESHLNTVFGQRGVGWEEKKLSEVTESISTGPFGTMLHKSDYVPEGIPLVNPMNIVDSRIVPSSRMMVSEKTRKRLNAYALKTGDIVIGRRGELGRCALVTDAESGWLCGTGSFILRLSKFMDRKFFVALFSSKQFRELLEKNSIGTTMSNLNHTILNDLPILVPPLSEQVSIMARADAMLAEVENLESNYQQKLAALEELKKSLLHEAFSGRL